MTASLLGHPLTVSSLVDGHPPADGRAIAVLDIRSLGLHEVVVQGTSAVDLMKGPGLLQGSVLPGTPGNSVIAGRRVTFGAPFGKVSTLKRGRTIKVIDGAGTFTYVVTHVGTVLSGRRDVIGPSATNRLTLITADSGLLTSGRLVVVAQLKGSPAKVDVVRGADPHECRPGSQRRLGSRMAHHSVDADHRGCHRRRRGGGNALGPALAGLPVRAAHCAHVRAVRVRSPGPCPSGNVLSICLQSRHAALHTPSS